MSGAVEVHANVWEGCGKGKSISLLLTCTICPEPKFREIHLEIWARAAREENFFEICVDIPSYFVSNNSEVSIQEEARRGAQPGAVPSQAPLPGAAVGAPGSRQVSRKVYRKVQMTG
jgi:hypothetical protein